MVPGDGLVPLTVDGLTYASSMVMPGCAPRKMPVPALARWLLCLGITATLAANAAHGLGHGLTGAAVAAWPAGEGPRAFARPLIVMPLRC